MTAPAFAPTIRLFSPTEPTHQHTLRDVFEEHVLPDLKHKAAATLQDYLTILSDWERLTDDCPAGELSRSKLLEFREALQAERYRHRHRSPATINKKFRFLRPLVRICWPADSHNPGGLGLCDYFRLPSSLPESKGLPFIFSHDQLNALYRAADWQAWPTAEAPLIWKTLLVLHYSAGPRTYDLLSLEWSDVDFDYKGVGSITFQARKTGKLQRVPLTPAARRHLLALQPTASTARVFPRFERSNKSTIRRHWRRLLEAAKIPAGPVMEDMRKTCNTAYNDLSPGVGDYVLGHRLAGVNAKFYYDPTNIVLDAVARLPMPEAFNSLT